MRYLNLFSVVFRITGLNINIQILYRLCLTGLFCVLLSETSYAQASEAFITGRVVQKVGDEDVGVFDAQVDLLKDDESKGRVKTDGEGYFRIGPVAPGVYSLKIQSSLFLDPTIVSNIQLTGDKTLPFGDIYIGAMTNVIKVRRVVRVKNKLIIGETFGRDKLKNSPLRDLAAIIATSGTAQVIGNKLIIAGNRDNANGVWVNGVKMSSLPNIPFDAIEEINVITGGVPAEYGDALGGIITITTRGPSKKLSGGLELVNSKFIDPFGYKMLEGNLTGPLYVKNKNSKDSSRTILGFFLAGNISHIDVYDPPAIDVYSVKDRKLSELKNDPITQSPLGSGFISRTSFITKDDMEKTRVRSNTKSFSYAVTGSLEFQPTDAITISAGGSSDYLNRNDYLSSYSMFNYENNPQRIESNNQGFVRFRQIFNMDSSSAIKSAYYQVQADYTRFDRVVQDENHKDNFWDYGYVGKFERNRTPDYCTERRQFGDKYVTTNYLTGYSDKGVSYAPGGLNPTTENYTERFFELSGNDVQTFPDIILNGGLLNGMNPAQVYSLWANPGTVYNQYVKRVNEQFSVNASASIGVKMGKRKNAAMHQFKTGLQFEQQEQRQWSIGTTGGNDIWTLARQLTNFHLTQLDSLHPIPVYDAEGNFQDTINYNYLIDPAMQTTFDKNFRQHLINEGARDEFGRPINEQTQINIDRYDPSEFNIDMFSPDELLGNGVVGYFGYDHTGKVVRGKKSLADFLNPEKRAIGAYDPIYVAGYIQDKIQFRNDVMISVGVRVDRFDANQPVLADPYSIYPIKTAGEVSQINGQAVTHPANIGSDYKVYVDDALNPTAIVGYRKDNTWYDATGAELLDPSALVNATKSGTRIQPYLENENGVDAESKLKLTESSFKDYEAQVNVMPRIAFSFPISETAVFYANYDVLTQRPRVGNIGGLDDYYYLDKRSTLIIANPALKPEKRTNYEVGFKQSIGPQTDLTFQAFYGEIRDMVQLTTMNNAYPVTYSTLGNIDFGTVKGFLVGYDFLRLNDSGLRLSVNYTLQFANGTGSNETASQGLLNSGQPNLRNPIPLDYDTRHVFSSVIDYRFGEGAHYAGPRGLLYDGRIDVRNIFQNAGISVVLSARSGTPYTRQVNATSGSGILMGVQQRSSIVGEVNGSRLPWQFKSDLRLDKSFFLFKGTGMKRKSVAGVTAYLQVNNVLNSKNIISVYRYTGLANDDGYLQTAEGQALVREQPDQQAFVDQYNVKMANPDNYIQPRFVRLGAAINF